MSFLKILRILPKIHLNFVQQTPSKLNIVYNQSVAKFWTRINYIRLSLAIVTVLAVAGWAAGWYLFTELERSYEILAKQNALAQEALQSVKKDSRLLSRENNYLREQLQKEQSVSANLSSSLQSEQAKNTYFQFQLQGISSTVGLLTKLSQTDKELLQKYSKVYFLSENYVPSNLSTIPADFLLNKNKIEQFHTNALPFLESMLRAASSSGITLRVVSAYRSFYDQMLVKSGYKILYGSGANSFSADQGYSEHQLGTTVDLTTPQLASLTTALDKDPAFAWLLENAWKFGFILSYPKGNSYYQYEPWHWRFVGRRLAEKLHNENIHFYDMTQRDIDAFLISIFD